MKANAICATALSLALTASVVSPALAQQGPVGQACAEDITKFCAGIAHGEGKVRACLEGNKAKVSEACKTALDTTGPGKGQGQGGNRAQ